MKNWISVKLGSLIKINYGKDHKNLINGDIPVYGSGGFMRYVNKSLSANESILIPRIGTLDNIIYVKRPFWTVNTMFWTEIDNERVNPKFLYYQLKLTDFIKLNAGSAVPRLTIPIIESIDIKIPPLAEQKRIAALLGSLDDLIENNRKMNEVLEEMAQAIFKSWFIDFDGVPEEDLVESELGLIPRGWEVKTINDVAQKIALGPFGSNIKVDTFVDVGIPIISGQHLKGFLLDDSSYNFITNEHADRLLQSNVKRKDIVFTHAGTLGQVAMIPEESMYERYIISQRQFYFRSDLQKVDPEYILYFFKSSIGQHRLLANANSTGVPSIARPSTSLKSIQFILPPRTIIQNFTNLIKSIHSQIMSSKHQIQTLSELRDTLLPKLISGELRIPEAEKIVEDLL